MQVTVKEARIRVWKILVSLCFRWNKNKMITLSFSFPPKVSTVVFFFKIIIIKISSEIVAWKLAWSSLCVIYTETASKRKPYSFLPGNSISLYLVIVTLLIEMLWQENCFILITLFEILFFWGGATITNFYATGYIIFCYILARWWVWIYFFHILVCFSTFPIGEE